MPMTTVYMTVDYMTVADTMLAPINDKPTTFVYSFYLCLSPIADFVMCINVLLEDTIASMPNPSKISSPS